MGIDGFTHPNHPGKIFKVVTGISTTFTIIVSDGAAGCIGCTDSFWRITEIPEKRNKVGAGGWKSPPFGGGYFDELFEKAGYKKPIINFLK